MKILVISTPIFQLIKNGGIAGYGGLEVVAWECARGLAAKGHQVALVAPDGSECPGVDIIPIGPAGQVDEKMAWSGYPEHKENEVVKRRGHAGYWQYLPQFDVCVDHSWNKWSYMLKAEGVYKGPVLGVMHAPINTMIQSLPPVDKPCIVCISNDQRQHFEALHAPAQARTCYNGIDLDQYRPLDTPRTDRFLFLARFSTIKGADIGLEACKKAGVGLDLIGDTQITNEPAYFETCKAMADGKQLRIIGGVPRGETVWWYSQAHCFLHPNKRFREPLGLAPLEAQACGLPVIAWRYGAMTETVRDNETGWLVSDETELVAAIEAAKGPIPKEIRQQCRDWASAFGLQQMVDRYEALCEEALSGGW